MCLGAGQDVVVKFHLDDALGGGVDAIERQLAACDGLFHVGEHGHGILQAARAEYQVVAGLHGQDGGLGQAVGVADAAHPERVADNHALEVQLIAQYARHHFGRERGGQVGV